MAYIDYLAKCPKHMCASDTVNISMIWPRNLLNLWRAYFSSSFPISVRFLFERKNPGFYLFSMYPGALARAYKIIKEGLIKGKVYTESSRISVQLPPPMFSVHCASSHTQNDLSWKENFLCSTVQLPNLLKYTVCASPSSTDIYIPSWFIENCLENRWNIQQQFP